MFTAYLDDSGTSPSQHVAIATALIIPARQILAMENEWTNLKEKEGFSALHMAEFVARNPKSDFANWTDDQQERVFKRVKQICRKYGTIAFSFAVFKKDYDEIVPNDWRAYCGQDHYAWALKHIFGFIDEWRIRRVASPLEYVFDWMGGPRDARQTEIRKVMERYESIAIEAGREGDYLSYSFRHRKDLAGLQSVDSIAWCCYQIALNQFKGTPFQKFAKEMYLEFVKPNPLKFLNAKFVDRDDLKDWLEREMKHPKAIEWRNRLSGTSP